MSKLDKELVNNILDNLKNKRINFKKKKDIIKTYENLNKYILSNNKSLKVSKFLKNLANEYNNILYRDLCKYNFKDNTDLKDLCNRSKIRGFKKVKSGLLDIAQKKLNKWEGLWSFCNYKKGRILNIKLIDPDILKELNI